MPQTDPLTLRAKQALIATARHLTADGKGILAADESTGTIGKRLGKENLDNTEETRRDYRELFITAEIGEHVSGMILYKETLAQTSSQGVTFVNCLYRQGVLPGIKVDEGLVPLQEGSSETHVQGLDNLEANCIQYHAQGARFAKWRAALKIGDSLPSAEAVDVNCKELAKYAAIAQACGLVPIVEPELMIEGTHDIGVSAAAAERVLQATVVALWREGVLLEGALLKPQMVVPGSSYAGPAPGAEEIAHATLTVLYRTIPPALQGIMFLSGGQSEAEATANLNAINKLARRWSSGPPPWALSFSFGRALQASALKLWVEDKAKPALDVRKRAQTMAAKLAAANGAATLGQFTGQHPSITSGPLIEAFRGLSNPAAPAKA